MYREDLAVAVPHGLLIHTPLQQSDQVLDVDRIVHDYPRCYTIEPSLIAYVDSYELFVSPCVDELEPLLVDDGFRKADFGFLLNQCDFQRLANGRWQSLCQRAAGSYLRNAEARAEQRIADLRLHADAIGVRELTAETLACSFELPQSGLTVQRYQFQKTLFPIVRETTDLARAQQSIGRYAECNGFVIYVDAVGRTFVAKSSAVLAELQRAGYRATDWYVPFSEGERIVDLQTAIRWHHTVN